MICPEVLMHFGFLHSFWTLVGLGLYRCSRIGYDSDFFFSFIFFLQLCRYHPFCHYFCVIRGDGYFRSAALVSRSKNKKVTRTPASLQHFQLSDFSTVPPVLILQSPC